VRFTAGCEYGSWRYRQKTKDKGRWYVIASSLSKKPLSTIIKVEANILFWKSCIALILLFYGRYLVACIRLLLRWVACRMCCRRNCLTTQSENWFGIHLPNCHVCGLVICVITRRSIGNTLWRVHAFGYNSAGRERIWMKFGALRVLSTEYISIVWSWPWQILGAIRAEARAWARAEIYFC